MNLKKRRFLALIVLSLIIFTQSLNFIPLFVSVAYAEGGGQSQGGDIFDWIGNLEMPYFKTETEYQTNVPQGDKEVKAQLVPISEIGKSEFKWPSLEDYVKYSIKDTTAEFLKYKGNVQLSNNIYNLQLQKIQTEIEENRRKLSLWNFDAKKNELDTKLKNLELKKDELIKKYGSWSKVPEDERAKLKIDISNTKNNLENLNNRKSEFEKNYSNLKNKIDDLETQKTDLNNKLKTETATASRNFKIKIGRTSLGLFTQDDSYLKMGLEGWDSYDNVKEGIDTWKLTKAGLLTTKTVSRFSAVGGVLSAGVAAYDAYNNFFVKGDHVSGVQNIGEILLGVAPAVALACPILGGGLALAGGLIYAGATLVKWAPKIADTAKAAWNKGKELFSSGVDAVKNTLGKLKFW